MGEPARKIIKEVDAHPADMTKEQARIDIVDDVTLHEYTQAAFLEVRQRYSELRDATSVGLFRSTAKGELRFLEANPAMVSLLGMKHENEVQGRMLLDLFVTTSQANFFQEKLKIHQKIENEEFEIQSLTGRNFWARLSIRQTESPTGDLFYDGHIENITETKKLAAKIELLEAGLKRLEVYDESTGLYNLRGLETVGEQQLRIADRYNRDMLFICADLEGLEEGDEACVKELSSVVKESFRTSDIIARLGFQSFGIIAVETTQNNAKRLVERLKKKIQNYCKTTKRKPAIKTNPTVVLYNPEYPCSIQHLLRRVGKELPKNQ